MLGGRNYIKLSLLLFGLGSVLTGCGDVDETTPEPGQSSSSSATQPLLQPMDENAEMETVVEQPFETSDTAEEPEPLVAEAGAYIPNLDLGDNPADEALPFYELAPDTYLLLGAGDPINDRNRGFTSNAGFIVTSAGVVVIDSLATPRLGHRFLQSIRSVTSESIKILILTGSAGEQVYASTTLAAPRVIGPKAIIDPQHRLLLSEQAENLRVDMMVDMAGWSLPSNIETYELDKLGESELVSLGEHSFEIFPLSSHTLVVHQIDDDLLWVGSLFANGAVRRVSLAGAASDTEQMNWVANTFPEIGLMVPSNGAAQTAPYSMLRQGLAYMSLLNDYAAMGQAGAADDTDRFIPWSKLRLYETRHAMNLRRVSASQ